jgi:rhodanese-related sulfurtransferase
MTKYSHITKDTKRANEYFLNKIAFTVGPVELTAMMEKESENIQIIDVRYKEDYEKGHIKDSISIPGKELKDNLDKLSKDKINIVYCYSQQCHMAAKAAIILAESEYPVIELDGGSKEWLNYGYKLI